MEKTPNMHKFPNSYCCSSTCSLRLTVGDSVMSELAKRQREAREERKKEEERRNHQRERDWQNVARLGPP